MQTLDWIYVSPIIGKHAMSLWVPLDSLVCLEILILHNLYFSRRHFPWHSNIFVSINVWWIPSGKWAFLSKYFSVFLNDFFCSVLVWKGDIFRKFCNTGIQNLLNRLKIELLIMLKINEKRWKYLVCQETKNFSL